MANIPLDEDLEVVARRVRDAVLTDSGCATPVNLRRDAYERARHRILGKPWTDSLDELSASYADTIVTNPKLPAVDKLVAAGRSDGRSDDEIFELTVAVALGAGTARLEAGLKALKSQAAAQSRGQGQK
jgi:hypothetical protein